MFFKFLGFYAQELFQIIIATDFSIQFSEEKQFIAFNFGDIAEYFRQDEKGFWHLCT